MAYSTPIHRFKVGERVRVVSDGICPVHHFKKGAIVTIRVVEFGSNTYVAQGLSHSDFSSDFHGWYREGVGEGLQQLHAEDIEPENIFTSIPKIIGSKTLPLI